MNADQNHADVVAELTARWPEHRIAPSLGRIQALCDLLGNPEASAPVIQITGTNGKGSTAIMVDALIRATGLRTGRFSSPHLVDVSERICIDGVPIATDRFDEIWAEIKPLVAMVDAQAIDGVQMTFFEIITGMAYAAFADAPVDVMVMEVGMGGTWDATSVATADVGVVLPIALDHTHILGNTIEEIATEKAGVIRTGGKAVIAGQTPEAMRVLAAHAADVGAPMLVEGVDFALLDRRAAVGGQVLRIEATGGAVGDLYLPLFGEHMGRNAAVAVAAVEALFGRPLDPEVMAQGLDAVVAPARLELVHGEPPVVLDTCHNPHGARATIDALGQSFDFSPLIGVVAMMDDKAVEEVLEIFGEAMNTIVVTQVSSTDRAMKVDELTELASDVVGGDSVRTAPNVRAALDLAMTLAEQAGPSAGVLVAGSVYLAGEARALLVGDPDDDWGFDG